MKTINIGKIKIGGNHPFVLIAGPCVIESKAGAMAIAAKLKAITDKLKVPFIFKASYDKANRTSIESFRRAVGAVPADRHDQGADTLHDFPDRQPVVPWNPAIAATGGALPARTEPLPGHPADGHYEPVR